MSGRGAGGGREWSAAGVVARLRGLIDERDAGDVRRAAQRLGVAPEAFGDLSAALADDARDDGRDDRRDAAAGAAGVLAAAARAYRVDATWLVTGDENFRGERLAPGARLRVADLLMRVGADLLATRRARGGPAPRAAGDGRAGRGAADR